jgi:hypothetical protein
MAARSKPAGIRSLVYGIGKGKVHIEGLSVSKLRGFYLVSRVHILPLCPPKLGSSPAAQVTSALT